MLTIGDGLVSQIPAIIISTAAGLIVARAGFIRRRFGHGSYRSVDLSANRRSCLPGVVRSAMALVPGCRRALYASFASGPAGAY